MKDYIVDRVKNVANFIIGNNATIRAAAVYFDCHRETIRIDMVERLPQIDEALAKKVRVVLDRHIDDRSARGGEATKRKFENFITHQEVKRC